MRFVWPILWRVRSLFSRKLGVCPFCMRTSGLGTLLAWAFYTGAALAFPHGFARILLLILAAAFTILLSAHIVAYVVRAVVSERAVARCERGRRQPRGFRRREFIDLALRAGLYAIIVSLPGVARVFGQTFPPCEGIHGQTVNPGADIDVPGDDLDKSQRAYVLKAQEICDAFCASTVSHSPCPAGRGACVQTGLPVVEKPTCRKIGFPIWCMGRVKECTCGCAHCGDEHVPMPPGDVASGGNVPQMNGDAVNKCTQLCAKFKSCVPPTDPCKYDGHELGQHKPTHGGGVHATIKKCLCTCI